MVAKDNFDNVALQSDTIHEGKGYMKNCSADMSAPFDPSSKVATDFSFYFGPNKFSTLKESNELIGGEDNDLQLQKLIYFGWPIVRWINRFFIMYLFDWLTSWGLSMGLVLLLLTLIVKAIVYPFTYKSYVSSAKMRALKPYIDAINAKYPKQEDAMKKQQEIMALYKKTGVSMFGGCLPMLLQFPILIAMFRFFPASIELRQQPFLWAEDLSTYDSIIDFGFNIPLLGDHISLFSLLCAVTMYFSAKLTQGAQMDSNPQAKSMKFMTLYFMPIFMFFICNNLSSGLTYYYFLSNIIMMIQTIVIRKFFVDEKKIMEKIRLASVKGANKPKSKFQQRLEAMQKAQQEAMREQQKNRR
jgi:YidC/Oxa1 family membrane protein insertase